MKEALRMGSGAIVWAAHFGVLYGATALACARGHPQLAPWVVALATLFGVALAGGIIVRSYPRRDEFTRWMTVGIAAMAAVAMIWEALAGLVAGGCE